MDLLTTIYNFFKDVFTIFGKSLYDFLAKLELIKTQMDSIAAGDYSGTIAVVLGNFRYIVGDAIYTGMWTIMILCASITLYLAILKFIKLAQSIKKDNNLTGWKKVIKLP